MSKALALLVAASISFVPTAAHASQYKESSKCSVVGSQYQDLKCVKIGKRKVWVAQKFVPWSEKFSEVAMSKASQKSFADWVSKSGTAKLPEYYTDVTDKKYITSYIYSAKAVASINPDARVVLAQSVASAKDILNKNGIWYPTDGTNVCYASSYLMGCNNLKNVGIAILNGSGTSVPAQAILAHENFHSVQSYLGKFDGHTARSIPSWFEEGTADYFGYMSYACANNVSYFTNVPRVGNAVHITNNSYDPYNDGRMAVEYIVASTGFQSVVDVYKNYGLGLSFADAFKTGVGITLEDFYKKLKKF